MDFDQSVWYLTAQVAYGEENNMSRVSERLIAPAKFLKIALPCLLLLSVMIWASSGTVAPYAASHYNPRISADCHYLMNLDHPLFEQTFQFLDGQNTEETKHTFMLRRILYPLLAYVPMKYLGFEFGGFIANLILTILSVGGFIYFILAKYGTRSAWFVGLFLATYPGISYWVGLPYAHALIVPCTLMSLILLCLVRQETKLVLVALYGLLLGVLFTGYDLLPIYGGAGCLILLFRKYWSGLAVFLLGIFIPNVLMFYILKNFYGIEMETTTMGSYQAIIGAYLNSATPSVIFGKLWSAFDILGHNFIFSNFIFLPLLFVISLAVGLKLRIFPNMVSIAVILATLAVFMFSNLAPDYESRWVLRGKWVARLYQPVFAAYLLYLCHLISSKELRGVTKTFLMASIFITIMGNAGITYGVYFKPALADLAYYHFYQHSYPGVLTQNAEKYGTRPYGFCTSNTTE